MFGCLKCHINFDMPTDDGKCPNCGSTHYIEFDNCELSVKYDNYYYENDYDEDEDDEEDEESEEK